jgi:hypothetical protein
MTENVTVYEDDTIRALIFTAAVQSGLYAALRQDIATSGPGNGYPEGRAAVVLDWLTKEFQLGLIPKIGPVLKPPRLCAECGGTVPAGRKRCERCNARAPTRFFEEIDLIMSAEDEASTPKVRS